MFTEVISEVTAFLKNRFATSKAAFEEQLNSASLWISNLYHFMPVLRDPFKCFWIWVVSLSLYFFFAFLIAQLSNILLFYLEFN